MFYSLIRQLLFRLSPEASHHAALRSLAIGDSLGLLKLFYSTPSHPVHFMGVDFPNPVGLAAGLDKNGDYIVYDYKYDAQNNWIWKRKTEYEKSRFGSEMEITERLTWDRTIEYY